MSYFCKKATKEYSPDAH